MSKRLKIYATIKENVGYQSNFKTHKDEYNNALFLLRGKEVKIDTKYLFFNQLNTFPIKGISKLGLRLFFKDIESIRIENRTFRTVLKRLKKHYLNSWEQELNECQLLFGSET